jgi:hypothetical protein
MRHIGLVLVGWGATALGGLVGGTVGRLVRPEGLYVGAILGAVAGVAAATDLLRSRGWLTPPHDHRARFVGLITLALAAPLAWMRLDEPLVPLLAAALVGVGMLIGAVWPARQQS